MPSKAILEICEKQIRKDLGSLDDLPHELANTVANVYYRFFKRGADTIRQAANNPGWFPKEVSREIDLREGMRDYFESQARIITDLDAVRKYILELRETDKHEQPNQYKLFVEFILDHLKYRIKHLGKKTRIRIIIERKLKAHKVREITGLIDLLDI